MTNQASSIVKPILRAISWSTASIPHLVVVVTHSAGSECVIDFLAVRDAEGHTRAISIVQVIVADTLLTSASVIVHQTILSYAVTHTSGYIVEPSDALPVAVEQGHHSTVIRIT